ncbi:MAG TPA: hypothetical protein PKG96_07935 [Bacilli bacterium]|nr:hypothetical protein [Bacilli bacterium]
MMKCPKCGQRMYVKATFSTGNQQICRTYVCNKCGHSDISKESFENKEEKCQKQTNKQMKL